jgi:hypothetical protein
VRPDASPPEPTLSPTEVDTLHIVAEDLAAFPDRRNVMAARVSEDLARLVAAAEAGPEAFGATSRRWPYDDALDFLAYAIVVAERRGTPEPVAQRTAARVILRRLKEAQRAPRDTVWDWEPPTDDSDSPA